MWRHDWINSRLLYTTNYFIKTHCHKTINSQQWTRIHSCSPTDVLDSWNGNKDVEIWLKNNGTSWDRDHICQKITAAPPTAEATQGAVPACWTKVDQHKWVGSKMKWNSHSNNLDKLTFERCNLFVINQLSSPCSRTVNDHIVISSYLHTHTSNIHNRLEMKSKKFTRHVHFFDDRDNRLLITKHTTYVQ